MYKYFIHIINYIIMYKHDIRIHRAHMHSLRRAIAIFSDFRLKNVL